MQTCSSPPTALVTMPPAVDLGQEAAIHSLLTEALAGRPDVLVLDFTSTEFFGATGVSLLLGYWRQLRMHKGSLLLSCPSPLTETVLRIVGFDGLDGVEVVSRSDVSDPSDRS